MNAHTPVLGLTSSAAALAPLLRAIAQAPDGVFVGIPNDVARAAGRDPTVNKATSRDLGTLRDEGFITIEAVTASKSQSFSLTAAGEAAVAGLKVAAGEAPVPAATTAPITSLRHDQLRRSPLNPRKDFDVEKLTSLREDIVQRGYLIQSLMVRPKDDEPGAYWIVAGESRWRAVGDAIHDGDLPVDFVIPVQVRPMSDLEHLETALAENIRRADLNHLEEAEGFALAISMGETPQTLADKIGRTDRFIQEHIRVLNKASDEAKEKFLAGGLDWTGLRDSVKVPKHVTALEKNPRLAMLILEIEAKARAQQVDDESPLAIAAPGAGGVYAEAEELGLLATTKCANGQLGVLLKPIALDWITEEEERVSFDNLVQVTREAALGAMGALALDEGAYGTAFLNAKPAPPPNPDEATIDTLTAAQLLILAECFDKFVTDPFEYRLSPGSAPERAIKIYGNVNLLLRPLLWGGFMSLVGFEGQDLLKLTTKVQEALKRPDAPKVSAPYLSAFLNAPEPIEPTVRPGLTGDAFSQALREANSQDDDDDLVDDFDVAPVRVDDDVAGRHEPQLSDATELALIELAFKVEHEGVSTRGGAIVGALLGAYHSDRTGTATALLMAKPPLIAFVQAPSGGWLGVPTQAANDYIAARYPNGVRLEDLDTAQARALTPIPEGQRFVTPWLNPEPVAAKPEPAADPAPAPAAKAASQPDPVMAAFRAAFDRLHEAGSALTAALEDEVTLSPDAAAAFGDLIQALEETEMFRTKEPS